MGAHPDRHSRRPSWCCSVGSIRSVAERCRCFRTEFPKQIDQRRQSCRVSSSVEGFASSTFSDSCIDCQQPGDWLQLVDGLASVRQGGR